MKKKPVILTILFIIFLVILVILLGFIYNQNIKNKNITDNFINSNLNFYESNKNPTFIIDKITYFSSCDADISTNSNSSFTISDLFQYTDIAIFISPYDDSELTEENTLKSVEITDIKYSLSPTIGTPNLYYKNINDFATSKYNEENKIDTSILFDTTSEDSIDYDTPILYNNCANPITLCYVNSGIVDNFTLENSVSNIAYNGSLLRSCDITVNSISCKLSFVINITNNRDEKFVCPVILTMPLSTEKSTIYDGSLTLKDSTKYQFLKCIN